MKNIGVKIKSRRIELGLTSQELADKANISQSYVSLIETEQVNPSLKTLEKLAKALNISVSYFYDEENEGVKIGIDKFIQYATDDMKEFLSKEENWGYIELAKNIKESDLTPEDIKDILRVLKRFNAT